MGNVALAVETLQRMDLKELRRVYRVSFKIKTLEPFRGMIESQIKARGASLPRLTLGGL